MYAVKVIAYSGEPGEFSSYSLVSLSSAVLLLGSSFI